MEEPLTESRPQEPDMPSDTPSDMPSPPDKASVMALASIILSLLGLFFPITGIVGLILGIVELRRIKRGESSEKGKSMAIAGVILGTLVVIVITVVIIVSIVTGNFALDLSTSD